MKTLMGKRVLFLALLTALALNTTVFAAEKSKHNFARWENSISQFEKQDQQQGVQAGGILFVGSSSIRMWDLKKYYPDLPVINRGFGGSEIVDSTHFAERLILKHKPKVIFLYAGDNDIARGRTAKEVANDFKQFVSVVHKALPETRIVFISVKPSLSRWKLADTMKKANKLIKEQCAQHDYLAFADVWDPMLGKDGKPRPELFKADGLHMQHEGYLIWKKAIAPYLPQN
ncbi:GDSL-like Lipase/Acylhydrolase [Gimesia panareensis]|uniref:GDSL-like Lipase/Acylhydrolase n=1 Tax=Gimesia panareensis TaxID=2527978 RepID=A0A518FVK2_9PLAN|nr:SGNH/GDSL hydrolase family protein [Gimesia panareensis]QDV20379.1 GDSL-like Lipase/Acylhydrolase [Gimesia panareensis]